MDGGSADAVNAESMLNAVTLLGDVPEGDFQLSARVYAYHASLDGTAWQLIRVFVLADETSRDKLGFEGQSPTGDGCSVTFDEIRFLPERLADLRDGS